MENLRKMFMAMAQDIRVILIKICDRLHNMRTMEYQSPAKQREKSLETMEIYAPIAHRLGMQKLKWELEDLSLRYLDPVGYKEISDELAARSAAHEEFLATVQRRIQERLDAEGIHCTNTLADPHIFLTFITENPKCQYGVDGIVFDHDGNLYVGNFGDGAVHKITIEGGRAVKNEVWAKDPEQLTSTDGICAGPDGCFYVADFSANAVARISKDGKVTRIAQSPDTDGLHGELDQPGEPIVWDGKIVVSCFDLVTDPGKVNTAHEMPATMAYLDLE